MLGALGSGPRSPLLAQDPSGRPVVLRRAGPPRAHIGSPALEEEEGRVHTAEGSWALHRYLPGVDLDALLAQGPLTEKAALELVHAVGVALEAARAGGRSHGALDGGAVRLDPWGNVGLVGLVDGEGDEAALRALAARCGEACVAALYAPDALTALADRARSAPGEGIAARAPVPAPPVTSPHRLAGTVLRERPPPPSGVPVKVRVAGTAVVTLALGIATGWLLGGAVRGAPAVAVEGAVRVEVACRQPYVPGPSCTVRAQLADGRVVEGALPAAAAASCRPVAGSLVCTAAP